MTLDYLAHSARFGPDAEAEEFGLLLRSGIDWNVPMQMMNLWYDRMVRALEHATIEERAAALEAVEQELAELERSLSPGGIARSVFSRSARSELAGKFMVRFFLPALSAAQHAQDRSETCLRLLQIAAALAIDRAEHGTYPASLDELGDDSQRALPTDPFTGQPFLYEKRNDGYVLWSVGRNQRDDKASGDEFSRTLNGEHIASDEPRDGNHDDIVLRVPWAPPPEGSDTE